MRHSLRAAAAGLVSFFIVAGLMSAAPIDARAATGGFSGVSKPKIVGTKAVGKRLAARPDLKTRPSATSRTFQWLRSGAAIKDATGTTYTLSASDRGKGISVRVCYFKSGYTERCVTSSKTKRIASGEFSGVSKPTVEGVTRTGDFLEAEPDSRTSPMASSFRYQWYRSSTKIGKATEARYTLTRSDQGRKISVKVCHKASGYTTKCVTSAKTSTIKAAPARPAPGSVWAWGNNERGQLGDGTSTDREKPVQVYGLTDVTAVGTTSTSPGSAYAIKKDGTVWAWGDNTHGQLDGVLLGSSLGDMQKKPVRMTGLTNVAAIDSYYNCERAVKKDGTVWEWGDGCSGDILQGQFGNRVEGAFAQFPGLGEIKAISAGLALKSDGTVLFFTENNENPDSQGPAYGEPGWRGRILIQQVPGLTGVTAISGNYGGWSPHGTPETGYYVGSGYALKSDGTVWAWGGNFYGQLGDGTTTERSEPAQVSGLTGVRAISAHGPSAFAVKNNSTTWAWGGNLNHNLGDGTAINRSRPVQMPGLSEVTAISPPLAVKKDGTVWGWGCELSCGISKALRLPGLTGVASVSNGVGTFYALVAE